MLLALRVNGVALPQAVEVRRLDDGTLALGSDDWRAAGLAPAPAVELDGRRWHALGAVGARTQLDEPSQTLEVDAPAAAFTPQRLATAATTSAGATAAGERLIGGMLNYDLLLEGSDSPHRRARSAQAWFDAGLFATDAGDLHASGLWRSGVPQAPSWTRLDTTWTMDLPDRRTSLRVGDTISQPGRWGRPLRYGGLQWSTDFSLDPGFLTYPLPTLAGEATLPSNIDVYVDNSRLMHGEVAPGRFELGGMPVLTGQGEMRLVVRDVLGREQVITQPYHVEPALLRPGLTARSIDVGWQRRHYGQARDSYGGLLVAATDRLGVSDRFTRELRAEWSDRTLAAGVDGLWLLPMVATVEAGLVGSASPQGAGGMLTLSAGRQTRGLAMRVGTRWATPQFTQAGQGAQGPLRREMLASIGGSLGRWSLGAVWLDRRPQVGQRLSYLSLSATTELRPWGQFGVFLQHDRTGGGVAVSVSLQRAFGPRDSAGASVERRNGRERTQLRWQRAVPDAPGGGGSVTLDAGRSSRGVAQGQLNLPETSLTGGVAVGEGQTALRVGATGSLAWLGDSLYAARRIDGSFAVVDVGHRDVPVRLENRVVAQTDANGRAVVPGLRAHVAQRLSIDAEALPMEAALDGGVERTVVPPARSGMRIDMGVRSQRLLRLRLVDAQGTPLPPGTALAADDEPLELPVGFDGQVVAEARFAGRLLGAPTRHCTARLGAPASLDAQADLGTLVCR